MKKRTLNAIRIIAETPPDVLAHRLSLHGEDALVIKKILEDWLTRKKSFVPEAWNETLEELRATIKKATERPNNAP